MGIAHHAAYVVWLEECRIQMLRDLGFSYRELEKQGILMPVIEVNIRYRTSLRFDDVATCVTTMKSKGPSRVEFSTIISLAEVICAEATVTVAGMSPAGRPIRVPAELVALLTASTSA
jgi:acyl-CoA thioester hydrolase